MNSSPKTTLMGVIAFGITVLAMCFFAYIGQLNDKTIGVLFGMLALATGINSIGNMLSADASKAKTVIDATLNIANPETVKKEQLIVSPDDIIKNVEQKL